MLSSRRSLLAAALALTCLGSLVGPEARAEDPKEVRLDWATYNPVGLLLKEKGFLEEALAPRGIKVRWVQSLGSNKALEYLNAEAIDFGSAAVRPRWSRGSMAIRSRPSTPSRVRNGRRWSPARTAASPSRPTSRASASRSPGAPIRTFS